MTTPETCFSDQLKKLRQSDQITQEHLAQKTSTTASSISCYEKNRRKPSLDTVIKLADYFGVSVDYLLGRKQILEINLDGLNEDDKLVILHILQDFKKT